MKRPIIRGIDVQDAVAAEAARISTAMNKLSADRLMVAQQVQGLTPDQASMCAAVAHAFSLQRILHYPGLTPDKRAAFAAIVQSIMMSDTQKVN